MPFTPVKSSNLNAVDYDPKARVLAVKFHTGATYLYSNVEQKVVSGLLKAESKGHYFAEKIRDQYKTRKKPL